MGNPNDPLDDDYEAMSTEELMRRLGQGIEQAEENAQNDPER